MTQKIQTIVLGGGCFWCTEAVMERLNGVVRVRSGYAGGHVANPSYREISSGTTGHAEVIEVTFDPAVVKLEQILSVFFATHDPTTKNQQGHDIGPQYRSIILFTTEEQESEVNAFIEKLIQDKVFSGAITTEVLPLEEFFEAEAYHQSYYNRNTSQPYCQFVIEPKIQKLREKYQHLLKS